MKRSTSTVLVIFLALVGMMLYLNKKEPPAEATDVTPSATVEFLFSANEGLPAGIDIKRNTGEQVSIARNDAGVWVLKKPVEADADQGSAEAAASQVTSLRVESRLGSGRRDSRAARRRRSFASACARAIWNGSPWPTRAT